MRAGGPAIRRRTSVTAISTFGTNATGTDTIVTVSWISIAWARYRDIETSKSA